MSLRRNIQDKLRSWVFKHMPRFIFNKLTPCETIAFQLSVPEKLTLRQKIQIRFHLIFCHSCWVYDKQIGMIERAIKKLYAKMFKLSPEKEHKIEELDKRIIERNCCKKGH
jgi:hypothetical protein